MRNIHGGVILLIKLQAKTCNFTKSINPPWVFLKFLTLYKWYQIVQSIIYVFHYIEFYDLFLTLVKKRVCDLNRNKISNCSFDSVIRKMFPLKFLPKRLWNWWKYACVSIKILKLKNKSVIKVYKIFKKLLSLCHVRKKVWN